MTSEELRDALEPVHRSYLWVVLRTGKPHVNSLEIELVNGWTFSVASALEMLYELRDYKGEVKVVWDRLSDFVRKALRHWGKWEVEVALETPEDEEVFWVPIPVPFLSFEDAVAEIDKIPNGLWRIRDLDTDRSFAFNRGK